MKNNVIDQLNEALGLLIDYPGIADILDVKEARATLAAISKTDLALAPRFKAIELNELVAKSKESVEEWVEFIRDLHEGVFSVEFPSGDFGIVFDGYVYANLADLHSTSDSSIDRSLGFKFCSCDSAEFNGIKGTWPETLERIAKHIDENFAVPEMPK